MSNEFSGFQLADAADDAQIIAEIEGRAVAVLGYEFNDGTKTVLGLSKKGVDMAIAYILRTERVFFRESMSMMSDGAEEALFSASVQDTGLGRFKSVTVFT